MTQHKLPGDWIDLTEEQLISRLSDNESIDPLVAQLLSDSTSWEVKELVEEISYRGLPEEWKSLPDNEYIGDKLREEHVTDKVVLDILAKSSDFYVREAVASNLETSKLVLEILAQSDDEDLASIAKRSLSKLDLLASKADGRPSKELELKSEPGGRIWFAKLNDYYADLVESSFADKALDSTLEWLWNSGDIDEISGVFSFGKHGGEGLLGKISINAEIGIQSPSSELDDGYYYLYTTLSKVSTGFDLILDEYGDFQPARLDEFQQKFDSRPFSSQRIRPTRMI